MWDYKFEHGRGRRIRQGVAGISSTPSMRVTSKSLPTGEKLDLRTGIIKTPFSYKILRSANFLGVGVRLFTSLHTEWDNASETRIQCIRKNAHSELTCC